MLITNRSIVGSNGAVIGSKPPFYPFERLPVFLLCAILEARKMIGPLPKSQGFA